MVGAAMWRIRSLTRRVWWFGMGRSRAEFLLERGIVKVLDDNDDVHMAMILSHPRGMTLGKKAWNVFTAACDFSLC